jgi:predicted acyl esterase
MARLVQSLSRDGTVDNGIVITRAISRIVSNYADKINFDQTESAFSEDTSVKALFSELGSRLRTPSQARNHLRRALLGARKLTDVRIPTREPGHYLLADIFMPLYPGKFPAILSSTRYGKSFHNPSANTPRVTVATPAQALALEDVEDAYFENDPAPGAPRKAVYETFVMPNVTDWLPHGYVLVRIDARGSGNTPGELHPYGPAEAEDTYDAIEWVAAQDWSNGNVGMWGVSNSAVNQLPAASLQPPHLKALISHSTDIDQYRDLHFHGGLRYAGFRDNWYYRTVADETMRCRGQSFVDALALTKDNPFDDPRIYGPYRRDPVSGERLPKCVISPDPDKITQPILIAMRQDVWPTHIRGASETFRVIASKHKLLCVEAGDEYTRAWAPDTVALHMKFFDYWLKGIDNGIMDEPAIFLDIRQPRDQSNPNGSWKTRREKEWPLARTEYKRFYLDWRKGAANGGLMEQPPKHNGEVVYSADVETGSNGHHLDCSQYGVSFISQPLAADLEIAGYMKLGLKASSTSADMDIYAALRVMDQDGNEVFYHSTGSAPSPITLGFLKVSRRKLDLARSTPFMPIHSHLQRDHQPLAPGEAVSFEVELWANTAFVRKGHRLWLSIQPHDSCFRYADYTHEYDRSYHRGAFNTLFTGGENPAYLQIPSIPIETGT